MEYGTVVAMLKGGGGVAREQESIWYLHDSLAIYLSRLAPNAKLRERPSINYIRIELIGASRLKIRNEDVFTINRILEPKPDFKHKQLETGQAIEMLFKIFIEIGMRWMSDSSRLAIQELDDYRFPAASIDTKHTFCFFEKTLSAHIVVMCGGPI